MKKLSILGIFAALLLLVGCQEEETPDLGVENQWLQFGNAEYALPENGEPLVVTVYYAADENPNGVTFNYTVTSAQPDRYTVNSSSGTVEIPAGEFSADIIIEPIDNFETDGDAEVILELTSDSGAPVGIGGEGIYNNTAVITIVDDDCPIDINSFVGTYTVEEQFTSGVNAPNGLSDFFGESYQVELSLVPGDVTGTQVMITNSPGYNTYFEEGTIMTFRTCTKTVHFNAGNPYLAVFATMTIESTSYDENTMQITANGPLATYGPYQFLLTKQ